MKFKLIGGIVHFEAENEKDVISGLKMCETKAPVSVGGGYTHKRFTAEQIADMVAMKIAGATYKQIAFKYGVSHSTAHSYIAGKPGITRRKRRHKKHYKNPEVHNPYEGITGAFTGTL